MAGPIDVKSVGKRWLVRARLVVALEVHSGVGLWCFAWVLEFAGVPSGLLGESSFVVLGLGLTFYQSSHHWRGRGGTCVAG